MPILFGNIRKPDGTAYVGAKINFRVEGDNPSRYQSDVRADLDVVFVTDNAGFFSSGLDPGPYYVWLGAGRHRLVHVPGTTAYVLFADLFEPGPQDLVAIRGQNWRLSNAERQLINAVLGTFHVPFIDDVSGQKELAFASDTGGSATANFRYRDGMLELSCPETATWHAPLLSDGELVLAADGETPRTVDRFQGGVWQLLDQVTGFYRSWFVVGSEGSETLALGQEIL